MLLPVVGNNAKTRGLGAARGCVFNETRYLCELSRNCEQAFRFYEQHLGGKITGIIRHGAQPSPHLPAEWKDKILHARIELGWTVLMGADVAQAEPMRSAYLTLHWIRAEAERLYGLLMEGGEIFMEDGEDPFANRFAMLRDRFGTSWMLLHRPAADS